MRRRTLLAAAVVVIALGAAGYWISNSRTESAGTDLLPVDTPPGIMLQPLGLAQGYGDGRPGTIRKDPGGTQLAYADTAGKTLYTYDKDIEPGKPACAGD